MLKTTKRTVAVISAATVVLINQLTAAEAIRDDREIVFSKEVCLIVKPPCTLDSRGSKLTVYPQEMRFSDFVKAVQWEHKMPAYLEGSDESSISFDFDLTQSVTFQKAMVLIIRRTTSTVSSKGTIIVRKGSILPTIAKRKRSRE